jgi:hypothetical protein
MPKSPKASSEGQGSSRADAADELIVYTHSNVIYWWPVWLYGYFCAAYTWSFGKLVEVGGHKPVMIHPDAWLGLSFVILFCFVFWATHVKARGVWSLVAVLVTILLAIGIQWTFGWAALFGQLAFLLVYMNLAFYLFLSTFFLVIWVISFFIMSRFTYWRFTHGQVTAHRFGGLDHSLDTLGMGVKKLPDDLFLHWLLGLGAGDLELTMGGEKFLIENVLNVRGRAQQAQTIIRRVK